MGGVFGIVLGFAAIIFAVFNNVYFFQKKYNQRLGFISLSLTALTVCAFYYDATKLPTVSWSTDIDVMPHVNRILLICVISSIMINSVPIFYKKN